MLTFNDIIAYLSFLAAKASVNPSTYKTIIFGLIKGFSETFAEFNIRFIQIIIFTGGIKMKVEDLKNELFKDNYMDMAIKEYLTFKNTDDYDETYKKQALLNINNYLRDKKITSENIVDIVDYFQKKIHLVVVLFIGAT